MRDGVADVLEETPRGRLTYPFEAGPQTGEAIDLALGLKWMRMPMDGPLKFINIWAISEKSGWAIVDTGLANDATRAAWPQVLAGPLGGRPVTRILATHMHPDHVGMAGWLARAFDCRLWMSRLEFITCRSLASDTGKEAPSEAVAFYHAAGWAPEQVAFYRERFGTFGRSMTPLPNAFTRLSDGDELQIGDHLWRVVVGCGHSPEHACLWCPELNVLISGDQVLPKISSNVSVFPTEPEADPLTDWLTSLARIKAIVPNEVLVAPAHNDPFFGLHPRIDHLIEGHERGLARVLAAIAEPKRAVDIFSLLFRRPIDNGLLSMATGESVAHLNCLIARGLATRSRDEAGVDWYRAQL